MKGLLKNNLLAAYANAKIFFIFIFLFGAFVVAVISQSLLIGFVLTGMVGFSANALVAAKNEFASKWGKYKLTLPVKRADIIKSLFLNQLIWLMAGTLLAMLATGLSWLLHGCPFDQPIDILSMFALGFSMSLFMGAIFFPLFYLGGEGSGEVFMIISLLCAFGIDLVIFNLMNDLLEPGISAVLLGDAALFTSSLLAFVFSCLLTVGIFRRKEY